MAGRGDYGGEVSDDELVALARISGASFGIATDKVAAWLARSRDQLRVVRRDGNVLGGLLLVPMGQFHGGRAVGMTGISGVVVAPSERGSGAGTALMHEAVRELCRQGVALSALYPATVPVYRRAGYELAGTHMRVRVPLHRVDGREREPALRPMRDDDREAVRRCYRAVAARRPGWLDRGDYIWKRLWQPRDGREIYGHVVESADIEGYVIHDQPRRDDGRYDLAVRDMVATTPAAARRLLAFFADHRSLAVEATWTGGIDDPFVHLLGEQHGVAMERVEPWMLRLVDAARALEARGYAPGLSARLELELADEVVAENAGRLVLAVEGGRAAVERGAGAGRVRLDVRALASLYSGYASAEMLAAVGAVEGPDAALAQLSAVFAGPPPSCPDFF